MTPRKPPRESLGAAKTHQKGLHEPRTGQQEWQQAFMEAPKTWCSFVLSHLEPRTALLRDSKHGSWLW